MKWIMFHINIYVAANLLYSTLLLLGVGGEKFFISLTVSVSLSQNLVNASFPIWLIKKTRFETLYDTSLPLVDVHYVRR